MLAVQICADIASQILADAGWPAARALAETFGRLGEHERLDRAAAAYSDYVRDLPQMGLFPMTDSLT